LRIFALLCESSCNSFLPKKNKKTFIVKNHVNKQLTKSEEIFQKKGCLKFGKAEKVATFAPALKGKVLTHTAGRRPLNTGALLYYRRGEVKKGKLKKK
jgi:hypothetical protein